MGILMYILAAVMIIAWVIGYYGTNTGGIIHILLGIAAIAIVLGVKRGQQVSQEKFK
jgi:hypothetical protein